MSAFDDLDNADPNPAIITALSRLDDIDAVTLVYDDETDTRTVDIKPVCTRPCNFWLPRSACGYRTARTSSPAWT